ncbi:MAG: hypothetical protein KAI28_06660, partial [Sphingomonadales bacterium]|nr:hypothetical protein [Sphingomonadales bacterium]
MNISVDRNVKNPKKGAFLSDAILFRNAYPAMAVMDMANMPPVAPSPPAQYRAIISMAPAIKLEYGPPNA